MTNKDIQEYIELKIEDFLNIWNNESDVKVPNIESVFNLTGTTAGMFCHDEKSYFRWNIKIATDNQSDYDQTIGHEVAHHITRTLDRINHRISKPHGHLWQFVMRQLGLEPKRTHSYKCEKARKVARPMLWTCSCCKASARITLRKYNGFVQTMNPVTGLTNYKCKCGQSVNVFTDCKAILN